MYSSVSSMGSSHLDISAVLEHAENVFRKSRNFRCKWPNELYFARDKIFQDVTNAIQKAIRTLLHWETNFKKEIPEIPVDAIKGRLNDMCSVEDMLLKKIAKIRLLMTSSEDKDALLQEANELSKIIATIEEKMRYSVFPVVIFHEVAPFSEENWHKFWTLATLDIQPDQLILQCSSDVKIGTAIFCISVPHTKWLAQLAKLLKCTMELEGTEVLQELNPKCTDGHIAIEVIITSPCYHTINVQLCEHHIYGSPFKFLPFHKADPVAIEQYRAESVCCSLLKDQETFITFDSDSSYSSSCDDDPMMDSQEYQCRRQRLSKVGIARVNSFLGEAALDRAYETTVQEDHKVQEDDKSVKTCQKKSSFLEKKVLESKAFNFDIDNEYQEIDMHVNKETEKKSSAGEKAIIEINNIDLKNVEAFSQEHAQFEIKRGRSSLSKQVVGELKKSIATGDELAEVGNVADNVELAACQNNLSQNVEIVKLGQTTSERMMIMCEGELLKSMVLDDSVNHTRNEPENPDVFIRKVASRKLKGLIQPLRRPRVPSLLSEVTGVHHQKSEDLKKSEDVDNTEKTPLLKFEVQSATLQPNSNDKPGTTVSDVDMKILTKVPQKIVQTTVHNKNQIETCKALKSTDFCAEIEDVKTVSIVENDCFAKSGAKKIAFDESVSHQEDSVRQGTKGKKPTSLATKTGKYQNDCIAKLSGKMSKKLYGPSDDPLFQPIGIAELNDKKVVVADTFNNRMGLFSSEGVFLKYLNSVHLQQPSAVVVLQDGNFAVKENKGIIIFRENGDFLKALSAPLKRPYGLTVLEDGNLMTVETTAKGYLTLVTVNPDSGLEISRVRVDLGLPAKYHRISKPRFISYHRHGRILVVDLGLNCIFIVDINHGCVLSVFGEEGSYEGQFRDPSGIACDSDGYIVVGDSRNHRVQVFDPYGHFLCILATDVPLNRPSGICLTSAGELLVSNYWDQSVARYLITY